MCCNKTFLTHLPVITILLVGNFFRHGFFKLHSRKDLAQLIPNRLKAEENSN